MCAEIEKCLGRALRVSACAAAVVRHERAGCGMKRGRSPESWRLQRAESEQSQPGVKNPAATSRMGRPGRALGVWPWRRSAALPSASGTPCGTEEGQGVPAGRAPPRSGEPTSCQQPGSPARPMPAGTPSIKAPITPVPEAHGPDLVASDATSSPFACAPVHEPVVIAVVRVEVERVLVQQGRRRHVSHQALRFLFRQHLLALRCRALPCVGAQGIGGGAAARRRHPAQAGPPSPKPASTPRLGGNHPPCPLPC